MPVKAMGRANSDTLKTLGRQYGKDADSALLRSVVYDSKWVLPEEEEQRSNRHNLEDRNLKKRDRESARRLFAMVDPNPDADREGQPFLIQWPDFSTPERGTWEWRGLARRRPRTAVADRKAPVPS